MTCVLRLQNNYAPVDNNNNTGMAVSFYYVSYKNNDPYKNMQILEQNSVVVVFSSNFLYYVIAYCGVFGCLKQKFRVF